MNHAEMCNWSVWHDSVYGDVSIKAALLFSMRQVDRQDISMSKSVQQSGLGAAAMARYEELAAIQKPDTEMILQFIARDLLVERTNNVAFWQQQILEHYPDPAYAWLHDVQNPFAQIAIAEQLRKVGSLSEAIRLGEAAVAQNHWHWGHYVVAGFYLQEERFADAERHLQQAIAHGGADSIVTRYRVELGDLYASQRDQAAAQEQYCRVIQETNADSPGDPGWREKALSGLSRLPGRQHPKGIFSLCSNN